MLVTNRWWHIATSRWREYPYHELTPLASMFCSSVQVHPWRKWYINGTSPWRSTRPLVLFLKKKKSLATSLVSALKFILCWAHFCGSIFFFLSNTVYAFMSDYLYSDLLCISGITPTYFLLQTILKDTLFPPSIDTFLLFLCDYLSSLFWVSNGTTTPCLLVMYYP